MVEIAAKCQALQSANGNPNGGSANGSGTWIRSGSSYRRQASATVCKLCERSQLVLLVLIVLQRLVLLVLQLLVLQLLLLLLFLVLLLSCGNDRRYAGPLHGNP